MSPDHHFRYSSSVTIEASAQAIEAGSTLLRHTLTLLNKIVNARACDLTRAADAAIKAESEIAEPTEARADPARADAEDHVYAKWKAEETAATAQDALVTTGRQAFSRLVSAWCQNFGAVEAPQPDRMSLLVACFSGYRVASVAYIRGLGGLATACIDSLLLLGTVQPEDANLLGRKIALNMVQVGGVVGLRLDQLLEFGFYQAAANPYPELDERDGALLATALTGGVADTKIDFSHDAPALRT